jgi:hypothetical protein
VEGVGCVTSQIDPVEEDLRSWKSSLLKSLDIGGMFQRNKIAHKWKAPFRAWLLRELVSYRCCELVTQSYLLWRNGDVLASLILMRSAIETVAVLVDVNGRIESVIEGTQDFHDFSDFTVKLLLGSKDTSTKYSSVNIITILEKCERKYNGVLALYARLSEVAHPNHDGMKMGFADLIREDYVVVFNKKWTDRSIERFESAFDVCRDIFVKEYNDNFKFQMEKFEFWIEENNDRLIKTQPVAG